MNVASVEIAVTVKSLKAIVATLPDEVASLTMQAPAGNAAAVVFGNSALQIFEMNAGDPWITIPAQVVGGRINLNEIYVGGTATDTVSVNWIELGKVEQ